MIVLKDMLKKLILIMSIILVLFSFCITPFSYAKLEMKSNEFYYSGTQTGQYTAKENIFKWLLNAISDAIDWLIGAIMLAFRAPFIGFTEIVEKLLTWTIESTAGINSDNASMDNSTDLVSFVTSDENVTVQAIVYNQVPAFNINFFNMEYNTEYSPTGRKLECEDCRRMCKDCCTVNDDGTVSCVSDEDGTCHCMGTCPACKTYVALVKKMKLTEEKDKPLIIQLKDQVAIWYRIITLITVVGMFGLLVFVGIKIAINLTTTAKGTYQKMLLDWVVGVIIIFTLHYAMYLTIFVNENLVSLVRDFADKVYETRTVELMGSGDSNRNYNPDEVELDMYEEVRSRAYDAKLINGLVGMVLYMSLVYMAIRYSLMYLKRLFTVGILILMGPAVGFAYALQKALSGRSMSLKKWTSEFIINVIIQTVHALIYAVFMSQVLILSLKSVAGVIIALITMNFSLKAEEIFRKVFKFSNSEFLKETDKAGNVEENARNMFGTYKGIQTIRKNVGNTIYGKALKGAAIGAVGIGLKKYSEHRALRSDEDVLIENKNRKTNNTQNEEREVEQETPNRNEQETPQNDGGRRTETTENANVAQANERLRGAVSGTTQAQAGINADEIRDAKISRMSHDELEKNLEKAKKAYYEDQTDENRYNYIKAYNELHRKEQLDAITTADVIAGHRDRLFDMKNYYDIKIDKKGRQIYVRKKGAIYGTKHFDFDEGRLVSDKNAAIDQLRISNLLGFTKKDSQVFKENVTDPLKKGFLGTAAMFIGLSTFVIHPKLGMGLIAYGVPNKYGSFHRLYGKSRRINGIRDTKGQRFNYKGFSAPTIEKMKDIAIKKFEEEQDEQVVSNVKINHPNLYFGLKAGTVTAATYAGQTIGMLGTAIPVIGPAMPLVGSVIGLAGSSKVLNSASRARYTRRKNGASVDDQGMPRVERNDDYEEYAERTVSESEYRINKHHFEQLKEQKAEFEEEALKLIGNEVTHNIEVENQKFMEDLTTSTLTDMGYEIDKETGKMIKFSDENKDEDITEDDLVREINGKKVTEVENRKANDALEFILYKMANNEKLDINNEKNINRVIAELNTELVQAGIITSEQTAEDLWKNGKNGLVESIKKKAVKVNKRIEAEKIIFDELSTEEVDAIKEAVDEILEEELEKQLGNISLVEGSERASTEELYPKHVLEQEFESYNEPDFSSNPFEEYINNMEPNAAGTSKSGRDRLRTKDPYGRISSFSENTRRFSSYVSPPKKITRPKYLYKTIATTNAKTNAVLTRAYNRIDKTVVLDKATKKIRMVAPFSNMSMGNMSGANIGGGSTPDTVPDRSSGSSAMNLNGNSQNPNIDFPQEKMSQYLQAITNYIELKKEDIRPRETKKKEISAEEEREVKEKLSQELERKSKKFNEALSVFLDEPKKGVVDLYSDEDFSGSDPQALLEYLLLAQKLNDEGKEISVKGSVAYKQKLSTSYKAKTDYDKLRLQIKQKEIEEELPPDYEETLDYESLSTEEKVQIDEIEELKKQLPEHKKKAEKAEREAKRQGPIVDINKILKKMG